MSTSDGLIVLGIDPGLAVTGYGVVIARGHDHRALHFGVITMGGRLDRPQRLQRIHQGISEVIRVWRPQEVAVEDFVVGHARAAVAIGEARAVVLLAAAQAGLPVALYRPPEVKQFVTSYGRGSKAQVQAMVAVLLGLDHPPEPADAADALAVALCHCLRREHARVAFAGTSPRRRRP